VAGVGAPVVLVWAWRAGVRRARAAAEVARSGARLLSLTGRVVLMAGSITGVQWLVLTHPHVNGWAVVAVLGAGRTAVKASTCWPASPGSR
jgi:hypothetical protein